MSATVPGDLLPSDLMAKGHGGKREGAGRPALPKGEAMEPFVVRLNATHRAALEDAAAELGDGEAGAAVRELLLAFASDDRVRRAVASWRSRQKGEQA